MKTITETKPTQLHATIKLGINAHAKWFYVARQLDGATPQPVQKMTLDGLLRFVAKQGLGSVLNGTDLRAAFDGGLRAAFDGGNGLRARRLPPKAQDAVARASIHSILSA